MTDTPLSDDVVERVAEAIWTAPITGQPVGQEVRPWPPRSSDAMLETMTQARAALEAARYGEMRDCLEECRLIVANLPHGEELLLAKIDRALLSSIAEAKSEA